MERELESHIDATTLHGHVSRALEELRWSLPALRRARKEIDRAVPRFPPGQVIRSSASREVYELTRAAVARALGRSRTHLAAMDRELATVGWGVVPQLRFHFGYAVDADGNTIVKLDSARATQGDVEAERDRLDGVIAEAEELEALLVAWCERIETTAGVAPAAPAASVLPRAEAPPRHGPAPSPRPFPKQAILLGGVLAAAGIALFLFLWGIARPTPEPPAAIEPTLERFEDTWENGQFADLEFFVKRRHRERVWRQFVRVFERRGWDLSRPLLGERVIEPGPGNVRVRYRMGKGELIVVWVRQGDGTWGITSAKLPPR